jgi:2-oxoglutarate dehydrogenase E1 component
LRHKDCVSRLDEMGPGTAFRPVMAEAPKEASRRVVLCSGKIAYDLAKARAALGLEAEVALVRLEQLHPFPMSDLLAVLAPHGEAEWVWSQEEPENQGALAHVLDQLRREPSTAARTVRTVSRPRLAAAAGGSIERHETEQDALVRKALDLSGPR